MTLKLQLFLKAGLHEAALSVKTCQAACKYPKNMSQELTEEDRKRALKKNQKKNLEFASIYVFCCPSIFTGKFLTPALS